MNIYVKATPLPNVCGRVSYIASAERQENLIAVYGMTDSKFWHDLAKHCQLAAASAGHSKAFEGREWHGALPNEYAELYHGREELLAKEISELIRTITHTENITALHWNKSKTNFHFHAVCSENPEVNEVTYGSILSRNTYYDSEGKRSTKTKCTDSEGNLLSGCELIKKGERKKTFKRFGSKLDLHDKRVTENIKDALVDKFNIDLETNIYSKFLDTGLHLRQQHIGKNLPNEVQEEIKEKNIVIRAWNSNVDEALQMGIDKNKSEEVIPYIRNLRKEMMRVRVEEWLLTLKKCTLKLINYIKNLSKSESLQTKIDRAERKIQNSNDKKRENNRNRNNIR